MVDKKNMIEDGFYDPYIVFHKGWSFWERRRGVKTLMICATALEAESIQKYYDRAVLMAVSVNSSLVGVHFDKFIVMPSCRDCTDEDKKWIDQVLAIRTRNKETREVMYL